MPQLISDIPVIFPSVSSSGYPSRAFGSVVSSVDDHSEIRCGTVDISTAASSVGYNVRMTA